jgi:hypothetical protein
LNEKEDLAGISTPEGEELAQTLRGILKEVEFDRLNRELQHELFGGDYDRAPYPVSESAVDYSAIRGGLELCVQGFSPNMTTRQKYGFEFLMLRESLRREELEVLFGEERRRRIDDFLEAGLFVETDDGRIRMNGLFLLSKRLAREGNREVIYLLADSMFYDRPDNYRVYVGLDSYELSNKLQDLDWLSGTGVDMGAGSGIQLIAALKLFPDVRRMVGYEKDRRAVNVSKFNAYLNGVQDRVTLVDNEKDLAAALGSDEDQVDFALTNPPFMPVPEFIEIDPEDLQILSRTKDLRIVDEKSTPKISLRDMWPISGWGGEDGLSVVKPMVQILFPLIKPGGRIIVYSEFAGNAAGPTRIVEFIESQRGWEYLWKPLNLSTYKFGRTWTTALPFLTAQSMATDVMQHIIGGYPELAHPPYSSILMKYADKIMDLYRGHGITHFHKGFLTLTKTKKNSD